MGKGDRKTAKGKRYSSSYGNTRPHRAASAEAVPVAVVAKAPAARKTAAKKKDRKSVV